MAASSHTIPAFFAATVARRGDTPALGFVRGGELHWRTWRDVADEAARLAAAIRAAGLGPGDCIAHVSENRYEWIIADLAIHLTGAVHVPIHVTLSGEQIVEQIVDCGARLVFVSNQDLLTKCADWLDRNLTVWVHDERAVAASQRLAGVGAKSQEIIPFDSHDASADDLATILYTSGTTGRPRGVMLSHGNLATNAAATADTLGGDIDQTRLCVLPLSHIFARTCDLYTWVYRGTRLVLAENRETLYRDLQLVKPHGLSAVPYLYQRAADKVRATGAADEAAELKAYFGGRMERLASGGAPLAPDVEAWYRERGLPILAGYGLTEASPVISMSTQSVNRFGSSGRRLPGVEVRIADDGEILNRGPNVMLGYWHNEAATAEVIRDGWLHTGDLGELDADGFLFIRGRKKELIVLSTGKKVAPTRVENLLTASPLIEQAAVFGEGQSGLTALIYPAVGGGADSPANTTREQIAEEIGRCLRPAAHEEQVHKFVLLDRPFSSERGELTPKLSLCRAVIARNFAAELATMSSAVPQHLASQSTRPNVAR